MQAPKFNLEEFKAGRKAITRCGNVATYITTSTEPADTFTVVVQLDNGEVLRYTPGGTYFVGGHEKDLVQMEVKRIGWNVYIAIGADGKPYIREAVERPFAPAFAGAERGVIINGFK